MDATGRAVGDAVEFPTVDVLGCVFFAVETDLVFGGVGADESVLFIIIRILS